MANLQLFFEKHADSGRKVLIFASFRPLSPFFQEKQLINFVVFEKRAKFAIIRLLCRCKYEGSCIQPAY